MVFVTGTQPISHRVGRSVRRSVRHTLLFFTFLGISMVGKFVFEHAPAQIMTAPAQIITTPAQIIIAPAHRPRQEQYTALFSFIALFLNCSSSL